MGETGIHNAKIEYTYLGREDHGIFIVQIGLEGDGWGQALQLTGEITDAGPNIDKVCKALQVRQWEKLPGCFVRVYRAKDGMLRDIGHFYKSKWALGGENPVE